MPRRKSILSTRKRYLQVALNSTMDDARKIISQLPRSDRILVEAGTPFIKRYGQDGIRQIFNWYQQHLLGQSIFAPLIAENPLESILFGRAFQKPTVSQQVAQPNALFPYVVADLKTMDRGETEVAIASSAGASAAIALGNAPIETLDSFIANCERFGLDSMIDMMNVDFPLSVLRKLKKQPIVVILHRGVDEEKFNHQKQIPLHEIRRIKGNYDTLISIAGGDTPREVQSSVFNDADIVVIWKSVYQSTAETVGLVESFLKEIK
mgnify:FL=1